MAEERKDKLIVKGLGRNLDGEYECTFIHLLMAGGAESLTGHEAHFVKEKSGVRGGELMEAGVAGDIDLFFALAAVLLRRNGKRVEVETLKDRPWGEQVDFEIEAADEEEPKGDAVPPAEPLPLSSEDTETPSRSGGGSSSPTSGHLASVPSPTGLPDSETSATSDPETLAS